MTGPELSQLRRLLKLSRVRLGAMIGRHSTTVMRWEQTQGHLDMSDFHRSLLGIIQSAAMKDDQLAEKIDQAYIKGGPACALYACMKVRYQGAS